MTEEEIEFVYLPTSEIQKSMGIEATEKLIVKPEKILAYMNKIKGFEVDSVTLTFSGGVSTGKVLQLFASSKAEASIEVTLKPK